MSKKSQFSEEQIDDFLSKVDLPLEKDKEAIWAEKFNSMVQDDAPAFSKKPAVFRLNWQYGLAASFALLLATIFYLSKPDIFKGMSDPVAESVLTEQDLLADQNIIESLFVEENEFDEWFEEQYLLSSIN